MMDDNIVDISGVDHLPNPEEIHGHINGLLDGKLGNLAKEIAEETANDLNIDPENTKSVQDVFKQMFKNPGKLMNLVKNVGGKLDNKIKAGEINESELMQEASELLGKMQDMPGMGDIQQIIKQMGLGGKGTKVNMGAMQNALNQNMKRAQMKERMMKKAEQKRAEQEEEKKRQAMPQPKPLTEAELEELVFSIEGDKPEKSVRPNKNNKNKKKKKGKKK
jgi:hypothetical protein